MTFRKGPTTEEASSWFGLSIVDQFEGGLVFLVEISVLVIADKLRRVLVHVLAIGVSGTGPIGNLELIIDGME